MRLSLLIAILLGICIQSAAIGFIAGSGETVVPLSREYTFAYHNGTDDYRFYGSDKWAVRYDFSDAYPALNDVQFSISKVQLYFPQVGDSVRVELFNEAAGQPGQRLAVANLEVVQNYVQISLPEPVVIHVVWLVVSYSTNFVNRFVSASAGDGSHSYYLNYNVQHPYFQNFATAGYNCELLFGLSGEFLLDRPDLELAQFGLTGLIAPREDLYPTFRIYNHSDQIITNARVELAITSPLSGFAINDTIWVAESIPPRGQYTYGPQSQGYFEHRFTLHDDPMQIRVRAVLKSELTGTSDEPTFNNTIISYENSFSHSYPAYLTENFFRYDNAAQILNIQDQYALANLHIINYFPVIGDSLSNLPASQRFHWYSFNSLPRTVMNGSDRITGYNTGYPAQYQTLANQAISKKSFISQSDCRFVLSPDQDFITATITMSNTDTHLYATTTDLNLITSGSFYAALFRKAPLGNASRYVIDRWITHEEVISGTLNHNQTFERAYNISLANITLAVLGADYRVYYWFQSNNGGQILYASYADFTSVVSNDDLLAAPSRVSVYPNPVRGASEARVRVESGKATGAVACAIYNLRGQRVFSTEYEDQEFIIPAAVFPSNGIYLLRLSYIENGVKRNTGKRISIIK